MFFHYMIKKISNYLNGIGLNQNFHSLNRKIFVRGENLKFILIIFSHLDKVRNYFGDTVAFYFAFLEYYTKALIPSAVLGKKHYNKETVNDCNT